MLFAFFNYQSPVLWIFTTILVMLVFIYSFLRELMWQSRNMKLPYVKVLETILFQVSIKLVPGIYILGKMC